MTLSIGHSRKVIVTSGRPRPLRLAFILGSFAFFAIFAIFALRRSGNTTFSIAFITITALIVFITLRSWSLRWTVDIDAGARRLRIERALLGLRRTTIVDCSFDACEALGVLESRQVSPYAYGVYVQLKGGEWHSISVAGNTQKEAARVADELSSATGIPRLDVSA
jgi:hypothetical protein